MLRQHMLRMTLFPWIFVLKVQMAYNNCLTTNYTLTTYQVQSILEGDCTMFVHLVSTCMIHWSLYEQTVCIFDVYVIRSTILTYSQ